MKFLKKFRLNPIALEFFREEVVRPAARRLGTMAGASIAAAGATVDFIDPETTSQVATHVTKAVPLALGIAFDLLLSHKNRKARK